jgi:ribosomal subunit interface protein
MDLTFTGRGLGVTDAVRETAQHKLAAISRLEPRVTRIDLEFIAEHHPRPGTTRVEAAVHVPRKTFRAEAEAEDVPTALDRVVARLERQIRDHHGKRRKRMARPDALDSTPLGSDTDDTVGEPS